MNINIPILPEAFLTFVSKSSVGPSYAAHGPYTQCTVSPEIFKTKPVHILKRPPLREGPKYRAIDSVNRTGICTLSIVLLVFMYVVCSVPFLTFDSVFGKRGLSYTVMGVILT